MISSLPPDDENESQEPPMDYDLQPLPYEDDYEMGVQGRMMDELPPDHYLDAAYEDRYDIGDAYEL
jgi:hypothetical protein